MKEDSGNINGKPTINLPPPNTFFEFKSYHKKLIAPFAFFMQILRALLHHVKNNTKIRLWIIHVKLKSLKFVVINIEFFVNMMINIQK